MKRTHHCNELRPASCTSDRPSLLPAGFIPAATSAASSSSTSATAKAAPRRSSILGFERRVFEQRRPVAQRVRHRDHRQGAPRPAGTNNTKIPTGEGRGDGAVAGSPQHAEVLPFPVDDPEVANKVNEELRLKYRYLDLRRPEMAATCACAPRSPSRRAATWTSRDFLEVETPTLFKSTPEGAREFLVPNRREPGTFYALPQSPQQFKQILMVAGVERYFQLARCYRDEDLRADRQPEFTQVDIEMSFIDREDIYALIEGCSSGSGRPRSTWTSRRRSSASALRKR
jgi:hypothetical protein